MLFFVPFQTKDATLNIAIAQAIVLTVAGKKINDNDDQSIDLINPYCDDECFDKLLNNIIRMVADPNPTSRNSTGIWLLALVKSFAKRPSILKRKEILQYAFTELLSDDSGECSLCWCKIRSVIDFCSICRQNSFVFTLSLSIDSNQPVFLILFSIFILVDVEFVQDVASRGLGLVYELSDEQNQTDLANTLLNQLMGGKRQVNQVNEDSKLFEEGVLGKTPTG